MKTHKLCIITHFVLFFSHSRITNLCLHLLLRRLRLHRHTATVGEEHLQHHGAVDIEGIARHSEIEQPEVVGDAGGDLDEPIHPEDLLNGTVRGKKMSKINDMGCECGWSEVIA